MKTRKYIQLFLLACVTTGLLAACQEPFHVEKGSQLRFRVTAHGEATTKTAYSNYFEGTKERINWINNDVIRIYSSDKDKVGATVNGARTDYYDYSITGASNNGVISTATLADVAQGQGLVWVNDPYGVTIYGTYPPLGMSKNSDGQFITVGGMTIPRIQTLSWSGLVGSADMTHAYMLAAPNQFKAGQDNKPEIDLDFYPVFNAFYVVLASQDKEIALDSLVLTSSNYLAGSYTFSVDKLASTGPDAAGIEYSTGSTPYQSLRVDFPNGTKITKTDSVKVTILARPPQGSLTLKGLVLNVYHSGGNRSSLALKYANGNDFEISAFRKARITGLAMEGGSKWQLIIDDQVLPWIADEESTSFRTQIGIKDKSMTGMEEIDASNPDPNCGRNEYEAANGYEKYYQIRTVQLGQLGGEDPHIEFEFTPTAPIGGYWSLSVESASPNAVDYFAITVDDGINGESERLQGQVMSIPVKIFIRPSELFRTSTEAAVHSILIHCNVSPSKDFDPTYSADSEFQDVHGDGRYSYWKFRLIKD